MLGGDGTILRALRRYAGTSVPVFAVNFGEVGFLATIDPDEARRDGFERALAGDFEVLDAAGDRARDARRRAGGDQRRLDPPQAPASASPSSPTRSTARRSAACAATGSSSPRPPGSTGYNLANGGPVLAWGVEGFVVSFIAPHSLTARALVVAPDDLLTVHNRSHGAVDVSLDGRPAGELAAGATVSRLPARGGRPRAGAGVVVLPAPAREVRAAGVLLTSSSPRGSGRPRGRHTHRVCVAAALYHGRNGRLVLAVALTLARRGVLGCQAATRTRPPVPRWPGRVAKITYWNGAGHNAELSAAVNAWNTSGARVRFVKAPRSAGARADHGDRARQRRRLRRVRAGEPRLRARNAYVHISSNSRGGAALTGVIAHELGHVLGLGHEDGTCATMNPVPWSRVCLEKPCSDPPGRRRARRDPPLRGTPAQVAPECSARPRPSRRRST